jgi:hypothetical protein
MSLHGIIQAGFVEIAQDAILFSAHEIRTVDENRANGGNPYLHGSFIGKDHQGDWTSRKLIHIFALQGDWTSYKEVLALKGEMVLVMGTYDIRETDAGNPVLSLNNAQFARFGPDGRYIHSDAEGETELEGEPGALVTVKVKSRAKFREAPQLTGERPRREPLKVRRSRGRGMTTQQQPEQPEKELEAQTG